MKPRYDMGQLNYIFTIHKGVARFSINMLKKAQTKTEPTSRCRPDLRIQCKLHPNIIKLKFNKVSQILQVRKLVADVFEQLYI